MLGIPYPVPDAVSIKKGTVTLGQAMICSGYGSLKFEKSGRFIWQSQPVTIDYDLVANEYQGGLATQDKSMFIGGFNPELPITIFLASVYQREMTKHGYSVLIRREDGSYLAMLASEKGIILEPVAGHDDLDPEDLFVSEGMVEADCGPILLNWLEQPVEIEIGCRVAKRDENFKTGVGATEAVTYITLHFA